jgi:hypothetical protein
MRRELRRSKNSMEDEKAFEERELKGESGSLTQIGVFGRKDSGTWNS